MPKQVNKMMLRELRKAWPDVTTYGMTPEKATLFNMQKEAVDLYIDDVPMHVITSRTHLKSSRICQLVARCVTPDPDTGEMAGYAALIPGKILVPRRTKLEKLFEDYPEVRKKVEGIFFGDKAYTKEHRTNIRTLHGIFLKECQKAGIQDYEFPFTTKDSAYEGLRQYINKLKNTSKIEKAVRREGKDQAQQLLSTGFGRAYNLNPRAPFDLVQIDGHIIDTLTVVTTTTSSGETITDIATRMWVIAVIDVATRCIIGYSVCASMNYNQFDVLEAIKNCIIPHEHKEFTLKSLTYPENGGYPSEAIPKTKWAGINNIMLDNAKAHLAEHVIDKLTTTLGCCMHFGSVATPETRGIIERFFGTLERCGFHRLPTTTGSNPRDPKRKNAETHVKDVKLTYENVCEILESLIAEYNNSAHSSLNGLSPLEAMATKVLDARMPVYIIPQTKREDVEKLTNFMVERVLRGGYESGKNLRINYEGVTYHPIDLRIPMSMQGEKVLIDVDPNDLRIVKMYRNDGTYFCDLIAEGEYGRVPHTLKTRHMVRKACNKRMTPDNIFNPDISLLAQELADKGKTDRRSRTKAANIAREAKGALDPKGPAEIVDFTASKSPMQQNLKKAVGETSRTKKELTPNELAAVFAKYPVDSIAAIKEIERLTKG